MGQKPNGWTQPTEADCWDTVSGVGQDRSVLILIKHCRDMKQQEMRLRLITLLLLLSCAALFIFTVGFELKQRENSTSTTQMSMDMQYPAYSQQGQLCSGDNPQTNVQRLHIHLRFVPEDNKTDGLYINWDVNFGEKYNKEKRAIVIPETGIYFIYVRTTLRCQDKDDAAKFKKFNMMLHKWNEGYNKTLHLADTWDGVACASEGLRSVFVGQLFDLLEGDHVSVWIGEGYELILKSSFGAYLA
ncbi:tumor necrosis factor ligand superfamily member 15-like [Toxotes jaculatrix]|uniref:tumor necrosis factor ligand superfamily member 15-like n=1 Tax=Toxotes jaculatrix TaxID=941984 RepID=UPI001B3AE565|nr:tumor necrosis factor ligand superfamily member 15-like [Toxotes jaculatrix]